MTYDELCRLVKGRRQGAVVRWTVSGLIEHLRWHRSGLLLAREHKGSKEHVITRHEAPYRCVEIDAKTKLELRRCSDRCSCSAGHTGPHQAP